MVYSYTVLTIQYIILKINGVKTHIVMQLAEKINDKPIPRLSEEM